MVLQNLLTGPEITGSVPPQKKLVGRPVSKIEHIQNLDLIKANSISQQIPAHCISSSVLSSIQFNSFPYSLQKTSQWPSRCIPTRGSSAPAMLLMSSRILSSTLYLLGIRPLALQSTCRVMKSEIYIPKRWVTLVSQHRNMHLLIP